MTTGRALFIPGRFTSFQIVFFKKASIIDMIIAMILMVSLLKS